jgi:hypothetical protein
MATPWSQSNDFRIAIAMKVALKATPPASTGLFRRHQPCACRTCADGRKESRRNWFSSDKQTNLSPSFREHFRGQAAGVDR